jgi:hypothetical protein
MGERLICDTCRREEGLFEIIKLAPLTLCERSVCGAIGGTSHVQEQRMEPSRNFKGAIVRTIIVAPWSHD